MKFLLQWTVLLIPAALVFSCKVPRPVHTANGYEISSAVNKFTLRNQPLERDSAFASVIRIYKKICASGRKTSDALVFYPDGRVSRVWLIKGKMLTGFGGYYRQKGNELRLQMSDGYSRGFFIGYTCSVVKTKASLSGDTIRMRAASWFYDEGNVRVKKKEGCYYLRDTTSGYMFKPPDW